YLALALCEVDTPCPPSTISIVESSESWSDGECLLQALRDRTPGRYVHSLSNFDIGGFEKYAVAVVTDSGEVLRSGYDDAVFSVIDRSYVGSQRCTLQSPDYFAACLDAGAMLSGTSNGTAGRVCDNIEEWFVTCEAVEPTCQPTSDG
ncbi:MAG: hypothetical protein AAFX99_34005, partial [Myxococcota bacterium]